MPRQYPEEFKKKIILTYLNGISKSNLSQCFQISPSTLYRWIKEYILTDQEEKIVNLNMLQQRYERLEHILKIIRLSGVIEQVPQQKRLEILARLHEQFELNIVHELCEALKISRETFYNHIFRKADRTKYFEEQQALMLQVQRVFDDSKQRYGAEKIRVVLAENGIKVSKKRIRAIMQELGLTSIRENTKHNYKKSQEYQKRDLLSIKTVPPSGSMKYESAI